MNKFEMRLRLAIRRLEDASKEFGLAWAAFRADLKRRETKLKRSRKS